MAGGKVQPELTLISSCDLEPCINQDLDSLGKYCVSARLHVIVGGRKARMLVRTIDAFDVPFFK